MTSIQIQATNKYDDFLLGSKRSLFQNPPKQHTPYATRYVNIPVHGGHGFGTTCVVPIPEYGDVLHSVMIKVDLTKLGESWYPVEQLFKRVWIEIAGETIDTHTSDWFRIYDELFRDVEAKEAYKHMTNFHHEDIDGTTTTMYLPLVFWFCRDLSRSLPITPTLEIHMELSKDVVGVDTSKPLSIELVCEYVHVSPQEKQLLYNREYVFDTVHKLESTIDFSSNHNIVNVDLRQFKHPMQSLIWFCRDPNVHAVYTGSGMPLEKAEGFAPLKTCSLYLAGLQLTDVTDASWFGISNALRKHQRIPSKGIYMHDFGIDPDVASGTINMSVIRNPVLTVETKKIIDVNDDAPVDTKTETLRGASRLTRITVFAHCWNSLVIKQGRPYLRYV
jgi:hypothetical protein